MRARRARRRLSWVASHPAARPPLIPTPLLRRAFARIAPFVALSLVAGCRAPAVHVRDADREVYEIVRERREELAAGSPFTIARPDSTLRDRLLAGDVLDEPLDLMASLEIAAENSRQYQAQRERLYLAALDLTLERWEFSVKETGTFGAFLNGTGDDANTAGIFSLVGLRKLLGTGMSIIGDASIDLVRDVGHADAWDAVSNLSLNITQPFLRGFGRDIVTEPLTQAERNVLYEARAYERFRRTFAFDVSSRFFSILQREKVLENQIQNYDGLVVLRKRNEAFAEAGRLNEIQVDQARQNELSTENRVIETRQGLEAALDDFKFFLGLPIDTAIELDAGELLTLETWEELDVEFDEEDVLDVALSQRLDYLTDRDLVEDAERRVKVAADALRMGMDLELGASATSESNDLLDYRGSNVNWDATLTFDLPFDRLRERNTYRASLIALDVARRSAEESADAIRADLRDSIRRLSVAREGYAIQSGAVALAERRVESAQLNLEAGRADTRDVLEAQEDLVAAQNGTASAITEYILSGLGLYRDMELLRVSERGIEIDTEPLLARSEGVTP